MRKDVLIAQAAKAAAAFMTTRHLCDRKPRASETMQYAPFPSLPISVTISADGASQTWDIEIRLPNATLAIWCSLIETEASYPDLGSEWPFILAAMCASGRGDLILEISSETLPIAS